MYTSKFLVVEEDPAVSNLICATLETQKYPYHVAQDGAGALAEATSYSPDVLILALCLPDMDGVDIIKKIRGWSNIPIIVVSSRTDDQDKVEALDAGADDYLTKPFSINEFLARIRAVLRRFHAGVNTVKQSNIYTNGSLRIDYAAGCAYRNGEKLHLTPNEFKLLCLLAQNTGKVLTHTYIIREIWGGVHGTQTSDIPSLRVYMAMLRKKIETDPSSPQYIQTHIGIGYRMIRPE